MQTEDLGKTYSTPALKYQAEFENHRRWLSYDLLCGKVNRQHPLYNYLLCIGIPEHDIEFFQNNTCIPDIFGFNYYPTSERYLDERLHLYPRHSHGKNGRHSYADVEAVRVRVEGKTGLETLLREAWRRYGKPMAVTEVHLHCHREEQLRWFKDAWSICGQLSREGVDLRAATSWALLGSFGWNNLLTQEGGDYEAGAFDIRSGEPRPTALAQYLRGIGRGESPVHPLLEQDGWWLRDSRLLYERVVQKPEQSEGETAPILIIGKNGTLGKAMAKACEERHLEYRLLSRRECDIRKPDAIASAILSHRPWAVVNAAGFVRVDDAEQEAEACFKDNTFGPG